MRRREFADRLVSVFFPQRCVLCGEVVAYDDFACESCAFESADTSDCGHLVGRVLAGVTAVAAYSGEPARLVRELKRRPDKRIAGFFCERLERRIRGIGWRPQLIVPVPSNPKRLRERGFNQAELLAEDLSARLEIPVCGDMLARRDDSLDQRGLSDRERLQNALRSFSLQRPDMAACREILLVDDVLTTGSTAAACAGCLLEGGAAAVFMAAATHTVHRENSRPDA